MKKKRKLIWQLYPPYLLIIVAALVAVAWYASRETRAQLLQQTAADLRVRAQLLRRILRKHDVHQTRSITAECREMGRRTGTRFTVILPDGRVVGDSDKKPAAMENHGDRPEIRTALAGRTGQSTRYSSTLKQEAMNVALPLLRAGRVVAVVRASMSVSTIQKTLNAIYWRIALGGLIVAILAALVSLWVAHRINRPLRQMSAGASRFAQGDLRYRLESPNAEETAELADALNRMAEQLDARLHTVTEQKNELEAVLTSMVESVLVVDTQSRLIKFNRAAADLFRLSGEDEGKTIQEAIRIADLHRFVDQLLDRQASLESEIVLHRGVERSLAAQGTVLEDAAGNSIGVLVVLHDVTRLKNLERVRRDFVANVSHELKTPITSIQGFVETLKDGAIHEPDNAKRFLDIVARHGDRLNVLIDDLLTLSRIEQQGESGELEREETRIAEPVGAALQLCETKAREKQVQLDLDCDDDITAEINPALVEQAVINLVDNAVKYSEPEGRVNVRCARDRDEVVISVTDTGRGIPDEHQKRIFERFYRVDKARSREQGGTGLGLAIVKHIAAGHQGSVSVDSTPGEGSTFRIHLPA